MAGGVDPTLDADTYIEFDFTRAYTFSRFVIDGIRDDTAACQVLNAAISINYCNANNGRGYSIEIGTETITYGLYTWSSCTAATDLPSGAASSIVVGDSHTSNHVDVVCTGGTAGSKVRLRRVMTAAELSAEGTNGNRIAIHAIAIMVDTCSQCDDIRYVLPKIPAGDTEATLEAYFNGFDV